MAQKQGINATFAKAKEKLFGKGKAQREKEAAEKLKEKKAEAIKGIMSAAETGDVRKVAYWLSRGADANEQDAALFATPLMKAAGNGYFDVCELLLEKGADPNIKEDLFGLDALTIAVKTGNSRICLLLIQKGAKPVINEKAWGGIPPVSLQFIKHKDESMSQKQLDVLVAMQKRAGTNYSLLRDFPGINVKHVHIKLRHAHP